MSSTASVNLVSVVIPCYNQGEYIDEAVDSILNQTYTNIEIIIVNDGSTDEYTNRKLASYNKPKTYVLNKENGHLSSARNYGIEHAKGDYILLLDADDMFKETFIEKGMKILNSRKKVGFVSSYVEYFGARRDIVTTHKSGGVENYILYNNNVACALIRREIWEEVGGFDENMKQGYEDWNFWFAVTKKGWEVYIIEEPLFKYRKKRNTMRTRSDDMRPELVKQLVINHKDTFCEHIVQAIYEREVVMLRQRKAIDKLVSSIEYKISKLIMYPFRLLQSTTKSVKKE